MKITPWNMGLGQLIWAMARSSGPWPGYQVGSTMAARGSQKMRKNGPRLAKNAKKLIQIDYEQPKHWPLAYRFLINFPKNSLQDPCRHTDSRWIFL